MGKSKGNKYSSYLDNVGQDRLEKFCTEFNCSKAKAISYLLELWENGTIDNKLATFSDDIYSQLENKLEAFINAKLNNQLKEVHGKIDDLYENINVLEEKIGYPQLQTKN